MSSHSCIASDLETHESLLIQTYLDHQVRNDINEITLDHIELTGIAYLKHLSKVWAKNLILMFFSQTYHFHSQKVSKMYTCFTATLGITLMQDTKISYPKNYMTHFSIFLSLLFLSMLSSS